jgi:hypothetical protein
MQLRVAERVGRVRWIFLPLGLCALTAVGAHAAADVFGDKVLWLVDRADALFDSVFASWSVTAPLVDLIGFSQRTFFARAVALAWELSADALIAIPLLGYDERDGAIEWRAALAIFRKRPAPQRLVRPLATVLVAAAGACAVARMVQGSVQLAAHWSLLSHFAAACALFALLVLFLPRAAFRALEHEDARGRGITIGLAGGAVLLPMMAAALFASPFLSFFR